MIFFLLNFFFIFTQPEDKRLELEKQAMSYQIDQTTAGNVDENATNQAKKIK